MIKISDVNRLVFAKFHGHKVRTIFTTLVLGLILGGLVAVSIVTTGVINTVKEYNDKSLSGRYFVSIDRYNTTKEVSNNFRQGMSGDLLFEAKNRFNELVAQKKAYAKELGIEYGEENDTEKPYYDMNGIEVFDFYNSSNKIVGDILIDNFYQKNVDTYDYTELLIEKAKEHGAVQTLEVTLDSIDNDWTGIAWKDGIEKFEKSDNEDGYMVSQFYFRVDGDLLSDFVFKNHTWTPENGTIPVVLSQDLVEDLLGIDDEHKYDESELDELMKQYAEIRDRAVGLKYTMCYRNATSNMLIAQVGQQKKEEEYYNKKGIKYTAPSLEYTYPDPKTCGEPILVKDNRSWYEKKLDEKQRLFDERFGLYAAPESYNIEFEVVGMIPSRKMNLNTSMFGVFVDLVSSELESQYIVGDLLGQKTLSESEEYDRKMRIASMGTDLNKNTSFEFKSAEDANSFIDDVMSNFDNEPPFRLGFSSMNKSVAIDDIKNFVDRIIFIAIIVFAVIEVIVIWLSVGRTIADSRKETAIMRALGFKRMEICQVYVLFTFVQLLFVVLFAAAVATICIIVVSNMFGVDFANFIKYVFYITDDVRVSFIGVDMMQIGVISCGLLAGFIGIILPLIRNVRRNPVSDLCAE